MKAETAHSYLHSLLNRVLHIYTTDNRMFVGEFKCTDNDRNIILASAHEYRIPPPIPPPPAAATTHDAPKSTPTPTTTTTTQTMIPRYMGLIVVPGAHVVKVEVEGAGAWDLDEDEDEDENEESSNPAHASLELEGPGEQAGLQEVLREVAEEASGAG